MHFPRRLLRYFSFALFAALVGALVGYGFGEYRESATAARIATRWGAACGTDRNLHLAYWSALGAFVGVLGGVALNVSLGCRRRHQASAHGNIV